jgi:decaprenyl-phosphate phosphoribosyltransferase
VALLPLLDVKLWGWPNLRHVATAVLGFILASALVYVLNDIADRDRDRLHVTKRLRPIASGRVTPWQAGGLALMLLAGLALVIGPDVASWWPLLTYLVVNLAYSFFLKHVPLLDLFAVAVGFVLRLVQGYTAIDASPSGWLTLCVLSVCLLLILGKRRHELRVAGAAHRPALAGYNEHLLDQLLGLTAASALITYQLYASSFSGTALLTAPFALFALFRYLQVVLVHSAGGSPVRVLLRDGVMLGNAGLWLLVLEGGSLHG